MNTHTDSLPAGYLARPATLADAAGIHHLMELNALAYLGHSDEAVEDVQNQLSAPQFDPAQHSRVITRPDGFIAASGVINAAGRPQAPYVDCYIHPDETQTHPELMHYLFQWAESVARANMEKGVIAPDLRVELLYYTLGNDAWYKQQLEAAGYTLIRHANEMEINFTSDAPAVAPQWPEGVTLHYATQTEDWRPILQAFRDIWRDHWGYVELPFEEHYERFLHNWRNDFKEGLWLVALVDGTIAGLALCETRPDQEMGYVAVLGVRREYRQRGIAMALLKQAFFQFNQLGFQRVTLHVDASNLTGALRLYERAGMYLKTRYDLYEKELRAGVETRTEAVQTAG